MKSVLTYIWNLLPKNHKTVYICWRSDFCLENMNCLCATNAFMHFFTLLITSERSERSFFFWMYIVEVSGNSTRTKPNRPISTVRFLWALYLANYEVYNCDTKTKICTHFYWSLSNFVTNRFTLASVKSIQTAKMSNIFSIMRLISPKLKYIEAWNRDEKSNFGRDQVLKKIKFWKWSTIRSQRPLDLNGRNNRPFSLISSWILFIYRHSKPSI